ncbi:hypothetical protein B0H14DRAFT_2622083 [Mycena olivaceomarginata]|nr:hypothetical protein B0H14DRAFT_2622083 [Mycena olivaceomarginata]
METSFKVGHFSARVGRSEIAGIVDPEKVIDHLKASNKESAGSSGEILNTSGGGSQEPRTPRDDQEQVHGRYNTFLVPPSFDFGGGQSVKGSGPISTAVNPGQSHTTILPTHSRLAILPVTMIHHEMVPAGQRRMLVIIFAACLLTTVVSIVHIVYLLGPGGSLIVSRCRQRSDEDLDCMPYTYNYSIHGNGGVKSAHGSATTHSTETVDQETVTAARSLRFSPSDTMARDRIRKRNFPEMPETSQSLGIYLPSAHHQPLIVESRTVQIPGVRFVQGAAPNIDVNAQRRGASRRSWRYWV